MIFARPVSLALLCGVITLVVQHYVGDLTIYRVDAAATRLMMHEAILSNTPTQGRSWGAVGANATNVRILVVYAAETLAAVTGASPLAVYKLIDMASLFATLLLLFFFLRRWFDDEYCLIAVLFTGCVLPLTLLLHVFHPWDRPSALVWMLTLFALRDDRLIALAALLVVAVAIKYDAVVLPGLYFLYRVSAVNWRRTTATTAALFVVSFGTYAALRLALPGGFEERDIVSQMLKNLDQIIDLRNPHPSLLGFALPLLLAAVGFRAADRFMRAAAAFGVLMFLPFFLSTNFNEFRAHMPMFILLLPAAIVGLQCLVRGPAQTQAAFAGGSSAEHPLATDFDRATAR